MARITIKDVNTSLGIQNSYDIVNAIRNSSSDSFQQYVPLATADNVAEVGAGIMLSQTLQNEFITSLVDRIGLVVVRNVSLSNPLKKFKKGMMPLGRKIEEIFTDLTKEKMYDPEEAESKVFEREIPDVKTLFHERNRQGMYHQTIQDDSLKTAFVSWGNFESFVASIINAIYNTAEVDEYKYMKLLIDNYYAKGQFKIEKIADPDSVTNTTAMVKKVREVATTMTLPFGSRDYNALGVHTRSDMENLHLFITAKLNAELDVDVLAKAFNMDRTTFLGNITIVDNFATPGLEAVLVDESFFMVYDTLQKMETIRNPRGLYWNYYYHVWQVLSVSRFANAVAFVTGDVPAVTNVAVDPAIAAIKAGRDKQFNALVRANDGQNHPVTWAVEGARGTELDPQTSIDETGFLKVGENQKGELYVSASVNIGTPEEQELVTGESIVTVLPK